MEKNNQGNRETDLRGDKSLRGRLTCRALVLLIAGACVGVASPLQAQNAPYSSPRRAEIGTGLGQHPLEQGSVLQPRLQVSAQHLDNVRLAEDGEPQESASGIEVVPGLYASYASPRFAGALDYALVGRVWDESDLDDVAHRLAANGRWFMVPEWFSVAGNAGYDDAIIDPAQGANYGRLGIFSPSNVVERANAAIAPTLSHRFDDLQFEARYSYGEVWYLEDDENEESLRGSGASDSRDQSASVSLATAREEAKLQGRVSYDWRESEFDQYAPFRYERVGAEARYQVTRSVYLLADGGLESQLDESTVAGGLDASYWHAGVGWESPEQFSGELRYGNRFFGDSYAVELRRHARQFDMHASYQEDPEVQTQRISLVAFAPGELPDVPPIYLGDFRGSVPYVGRTGRAGIAALGSKTRIGLDVFWLERDFIDESFGDDTNAGGALHVRRDFTPRLSGELEIRRRDFDQDASPIDPALDPSQHYQDSELVLRLIRLFGVRLTGSAETGYLSRTGDQDYDGWWAALRLTYEP